jgi:broad specificity phosphatase PhoE
MSEIYLIRHGQASFGEDNYDKLSPIGIRQAEVLARRLAKSAKIFDAVYTGELERQQKTAHAFIRHYAARNHFAPEPDVSAAFNEYDSFTIWETLLPEMLKENSGLAKDLERLPGDRKVFQRIFSQLMVRWTRGEYASPGIPRWDDFVNNVKKGLDDLITRHGAKKKIAVFTSGGPISVSVRMALDLSSPKTLEIAWQLMNASITRIKYNSRGIALAGFNDVTHLELERDESLLTYR